MKNPIVASSLLLLVIFSLIFSSCNNDDDDPTPAAPLEATTFKDLNATSAKLYTFFSFSKGDTISRADSATNKWDIAFMSTKVIFNSGISGPGNAALSLQNGVFDEITVVSDTMTFKQDSQSGLALTKLSDKGWYNYNGETHIITPLPGKVLVIRTADGKYAKVEILSFYKGAPASPDATKTEETGFYTFRYIYQPDGTKTLE
ncbi:HmuY family protein [Cytophagaceae bacterium YF14B1]|uniref:HmuY family protein n=1 Tax=Xanthocytophaga flava TaxID=3048013 RepID=A0AAE3QPF9_9BACT|nr:HmuY family protein [Xanthocytophaga flavus]MDJ1483037.1 HmuY family protein [Xanthocytophaga flavus]